MGERRADQGAELTLKARLHWLIRLFPLNRVSVLILLSTSWLLFSYENEDHIITVSMWLLNSVIALMVFITIGDALLILRWLKKLNPLETNELEVGQESLSGLKLPSQGVSKLTHMRIKWVSPEVNAHELIATGAGLEELISVKRRGRVSEVERDITIEDIFGFCQITWRWRQPAQLTLLPKSVPMSAAPLRQLQEGEDLYHSEGQPDGDLVELRRYQEGDPLKLVVWRLYARSRQLMVRTPERALSLKKDLVAYIVSHPTDEPSASTVRAYLEHGLLGEKFELFADGCSGAAQSHHEVIDHLLASAQGDTLSSLPQLLSLPPQRQRGCVVFSSAATPINQLLTLSRALVSPPVFVLSFPERIETTQAHPLLKYILKPESEALWEGALSPSDLEVGYHTLVSEGARVLLVSQPEGRLVSEFELQRMAQGA